MDDSFRAFGIDPGTTAEQLRNIVIERIELKEDSCFSLFEKKGEFGRIFTLVRVLRAVRACAVYRSTSWNVIPWNFSGFDNMIKSGVLQLNTLRSSNYVVSSRF